MEDDRELIRTIPLNKFLIMTKKLKIEIKNADFEGKYMYIRLGFDTQILDEDGPQ